MKIHDQQLLLRCDVPAAHVWPEIVQPPKPAALSSSLKTCRSSKIVPHPLTMNGYVVDEYEVLLHCPWSQGKQLEAIEATLSGRDCFCLMPTGGGKSMCYQIPALATSGIVLVISPLIALMENQVKTLKARGICADFLSSTQLACTKEKIFEDLNSEMPSVKLLYVTPELVATSGFTLKLINLYKRGLLSLIAIDEAHCISTWGHDFRPSYRKLSSLRGHVPGVPIIALTATAVSKVQEDVIKSLQLRNPLILRTSFNRPNIYYEVRFKDLLNDVYSDLSNLLKSSGEVVCSIVYCLERSTCDDLSLHLSKNGIASAAYHAGLNSKMRSTVLDDWLSSRILVVVATVAFGMGIDRKDVRFVCHFNIPKSMEAFYQESGRAGRDQQPSRSVLYYGLDDRKRMEFILSNGVKKKSQSSSSAEELLKKPLTDFREVVDYCEGSGCRRRKILQNFGEQVSASFCQKSCDACKHPSILSTKLAELERNVNVFKKGGLAPVFLQRSNVAASDPVSEFWNLEEDATSDEDISESEDEAVAVECSARSKISSKATIDEKFEALQRAEENYYQNKGQNKQVKHELAGRNVISEALRDASKKRLLNSLNQAKERLRNHSLEIESSSASLELDCFKKYEKVGKTFYISQIAATARWLSSASFEQIRERLNLNSAARDAESKPKVVENAVTSSSSRSSADQNLIQSVGEEPLKDEVLENYVCESAAVDLSHGKVDLPPIPSFSEFVNQKSKKQSRIFNMGSESAPKRRAEAERNQRVDAGKKMKQ